MSSAVPASARANFNTIGLAFAERLAQFHNRLHLPEGFKRLRLTDAVVVNHELGIRHVPAGRCRASIWKETVNKNKARLKAVALAETFSIAP